MAIAKQMLPTQVPHIVSAQPKRLKHLIYKKPPNSLSSQCLIQIDLISTRPRSAAVFHPGTTGTKKKANVANISGPYLFEFGIFLLLDL